MFRREIFKFGVVELLAAGVLLGKTFIDQCIRKFFPVERKTVPLHTWSVAILSAAQRSQQSAKILSEKPPVKEDISTATICVAKPIKIPPNRSIRNGDDIWEWLDDDRKADELEEREPIFCPLVV